MTTEKRTKSTQQKAARIAGFMYLITMATSIISMMMLRNITAIGNPSTIANSSIQNEGMFRASFSISLITWMSLIILVLTLYIVLKPVNEHLALLGLLWRFLEVATLIIITLNLFPVLHLLSGTINTTDLTSAQTHSQVMLYLNAYGNGFKVAMILLSLGSLIFYYLFFISRYIPRLLSSLGIFGSLWTVAIIFITINLTDPPGILNQIVYLPLFIVEVSIGFWLLIKGIKRPNPS